ncbi:MAG TPA: PilW family protein [Casimicrobiaceae bacterium]|jgi:type IV pilus assembly protein PilW
MINRQAGCQSGAGLVDVMVGVTIALFAVLIMYVVVARSEKFRIDAQSAGDAQQTGLFVLSRIAFDVGNAGSGFASAAKAMSTCPPSGSIVDTLRPVAILITDSGRDDIADGVVIRYGVSPAIAAPVAFAAAAAAGENFSIQSPLGFAVGDRVVAIGRNGDCAATEITGLSVPAAGVVELAHAPLVDSFPSSSWLVNLGRTNDAQIIRYDVVSGVLRTTDLLGGDAPNPLASNVVNLKLQYGIDRDGDGALDTWVPAKAGAFGDWSAATLLTAPADVLRRIKAIRIGLIVRSDFLDRNIKSAFSWTLFDCEATDKSTCPGRLSGVIGATSSGGYRYRIHETIVPLRNPIWNR